MKTYLSFEKPIEELELRIEELRQLRNDGRNDILSELESLEKKLHDLKKEIFTNLTPWQTCQIARHPDRPYTLDYINQITDEFIELRGDRKFADDPAIVGGIAVISQYSLLIIGHQKGRGTRERIMRNFGQPHPEGYRKALRLMKLAERFNLPIVTLIDTPGAFPGIGAEERGQAEAIATNLLEMSKLRTPIVSIVIGEGGSGGALALSIADRIFMLEHSIYSVISPEGCAAILWNRNNGLSQSDYAIAASSLKLTAKDLLSFNIIDNIIEEPLGGAHHDHDTISQSIKDYIIDSLKVLQEEYDISNLLKRRMEKLRKTGRFIEPRM